MHADAHAVSEISKLARTIRDGLSDVAVTARRAVSPGEAAWGDDDFGAKFAEGEKGFKTGSTNIATGSDNIATSFDTLATNLTDGGGRLKNDEKTNETGFKRQTK
ncbi:hypothetical protein Ntsu_10220 [Nocardia sp. IFM 10818]